MVLLASEPASLERMQIEQRMITVGEVVEDYFNDAEEGVTGYVGRLDIRPRYQR